MKHIRYFETQSEFVEELINKRIVLPRVVFINETKKFVYGKMLESFIKIDEQEDAYLGDNTNSFIILRTK